MLSSLVSFVASDTTFAGFLLPPFYTCTIVVRKGLKLNLVVFSNSSKPIVKRYGLGIAILVSSIQPVHDASLHSALFTSEQYPRLHYVFLFKVFPLYYYILFCTTKNICHWADMLG